MKCQVYKLEEEKSISPKAFAHLVSSTLYEKRYEKIIMAYFNSYSFGPFFIEPVIAGLDVNEKNPFICSMDLIGCINFAKDFVVAGTASANLYGICESLYEPDLVHLDFINFIYLFYFQGA